MNDTDRLLWLENLLKHCPHAVLTFNDDADLEDELGMVPIGFSLRIESCSNMNISAPTLSLLIDLGMAAEPDEDGNVEARLEPETSARPEVERKDDARLVWLEAMFKACPHAEIVYNDDPVDDNPVGFTILVQGCARMEVTAPTLSDAIALAMKTEPDEDGNVIAYAPSPPSEKAA